MIDTRQIPDKAGSAAQNEVALMLYGKPFSELSGAKQDVCKNISYAACAAMLNAWPGAYEKPRESVVQKPGIILPFPPQEK